MTGRPGLSVLRRRLLILPALAGAACMVIGYGPTRSMSGVPGLRAMATAVGLVVAIVYLTLLPAMRRMVGVPITTRFQIALMTSMKRFFFTLAAGVAMAMYGDVALTAFAMWLGGTYAALIMVETWILVRWSRALEEVG